jgi:hypothetical protein
MNLGIIGDGISIWLVGCVLSPIVILHTVLVACIVRYNLGPNSSSIYLWLVQFIIFLGVSLCS